MKEIIKVTLTLTAICAAVTLAVAGANLLTCDRIAAAELEATRNSLAEVLPAESYTELSPNTYKAADNGYIFVTSSTGYGGEVRVMTGIGKDGKIVAVKILSCADETPGLGQNAAKPAFTDQFVGADWSLEVVKNGAGDGQINAITSATITSKAVTSAVNQAISQFEALSKEGSK